MAIDVTACSWPRWTITDHPSFATAAVADGEILPLAFFRLRRPQEERSERKSEIIRMPILDFISALRVELRMPQT